MADESKKAFPLRISQSLYKDLKQWADQEMRSINGQIEYLLREAVQRRFHRADEDQNPPSGGTPSDSSRRRPPGN